MKNFNFILDMPEQFILLFAPTGWGKTSLILQLVEENNYLAVYLSPLRAINREVAARSEKKIPTFKLFGEELQSKAELMQTFFRAKRGLLISTPEGLPGTFWHEVEVIANHKKILVILDEIHLFFYWGEGFREQLWEQFYAIPFEKLRVVALTATFDETILTQFKQQLLPYISATAILNLGNQRVRINPRDFYYVPPFFKAQLRRLFVREIRKQQGTLLYFCQYRQQVDRWVEWCRRENISAIGVKGGEVELFYEKLQQAGAPTVIFSTLVLGHGVNLPKLRAIYIGYEVKNQDFFIQMLGRGGRNGERFLAFAFDHYEVQSWPEKIRACLRVFSYYLAGTFLINQL